MTKNVKIIILVIAIIALVHGDDKLHCGTVWETFYCATPGCTASITLSGSCEATFELEILEGDFSGSSEYVDVYVNDEYMGKFSTGDDHTHNSPKFISSGEFSIPIGGTFTVKLVSTASVHSYNTYNGVAYAVWGRIKYKYSYFNFVTPVPTTLPSDKPSLSPTLASTTLIPSPLPSNLPTPTLPLTALPSTMPSVVPTPSPSDLPTPTFSDTEIIIWKMLVCCIEAKQVLQTVGPVSAALGIQKSQVMILDFKRTGQRRMAETWALDYALFCEGVEESAQVFELLADNNITSMMEGYMETLFNTFISIDGDGGVSFSSRSVGSSGSETKENFVYYTTLGNLALILVCCCVFVCYCYRIKRWQKIAIKISSRDVQLCSMSTRSEDGVSISLNEVRSFGNTTESPVDRE